MTSYLVSAAGTPSVRVDAPNWITALGLGLDALGVETAIDRLACEVLPNGTVLARNAASGQGFVVRPSATQEEPDVAIEEDEDESEELLAMASLSEDDDFSDDDATSEDELGEQLRALEGTPTRAAAWEMALHIAQHAVPSEAAAGISTENGDVLEFVAATGPAAGRTKGVRIPSGTGIAGFCVGRGAAVAIKDVRNDTRFYAALDQATGFATRAIACVPVQRDGVVHGCLQLLNPPDDRPFTGYHLHVLGRIAEALAERLDVPTD